MGHPSDLEEGWWRPEIAELHERRRFVEPLVGSRAVAKHTGKAGTRMGRHRRHSGAVVMGLGIDRRPQNP